MKGFNRLILFNPENKRWCYTLTRGGSFLKELEDRGIITLTDRDKLDPSKKVFSFIQLKDEFEYWQRSV